MPRADSDATNDLGSIAEEILPSLTMERTVNLVPADDRLSTEDKKRRQVLVCFHIVLLMQISPIQEELRARKTSEERQELQKFLCAQQDNNTTDEADGAQLLVAQGGASNCGAQPSNAQLQTQSFRRVRELFANNCREKNSMRRAYAGRCSHASVVINVAINCDFVYSRGQCCIAYFLLSPAR